VRPERAFLECEEKDFNFVVMTRLQEVHVDEATL
jgi:hypothetical protein